MSKTPKFRGLKSEDFFITFTEFRSPRWQRLWFVKVSLGSRSREALLSSV